MRGRRRAYKIIKILKILLLSGGRGGVVLSVFVKLYIYFE